MFNKTKTFECLIRNDNQSQLKLENQASSNLPGLLSHLVCDVKRWRIYSSSSNQSYKTCLSYSKVFLSALTYMYWHIFVIQTISLIVFVLIDNRQMWEKFEVYSTKWPPFMKHTAIKKNLNLRPQIRSVLFRTCSFFIWYLTNKGN